MGSEVASDFSKADTLPGGGRKTTKFRLSDLLWALAYPVYQILGTLRHEASHALVGILQGAEITEFVFWPSVNEYGFYWGYVGYSGGETNWLFLAAPYFVDVLTFLVFFSICMWLRFRHKWVWLNLIVIGMISPLVNSFYNYWGSEGSSNDVGRLFAELPRQLIHGYFIITLSLYVMGLLLVVRRSKTVLSWKGVRRATGEVRIQAN